MSIKHFNDYYATVFQSYKRMQQSYERLQEECQTKMLSPDDVKHFEAMLQPVKDSYNTLRYIKYLLDLPNKKQKARKLKPQMDKVINSIDDKYKKDAVVAKNTAAIESAEESL